MKLTEGQTFTTKGITFTEMLFEDRPVAARTAKGNLYNFCRRCGGSGHYSFNLMDGTMCYGCNGAGVVGQTTEEDVIRKAVNRAKAAAKRAEKEQKRIAALRAPMDAWKAANADLLTALEPHLSKVDAEGYTDFDFRPVNNFLTDLADKAHRSLNPLSERQVEAAKAALVRQAQWDAEKAQKTAEQAAAGHYGTPKEKVTVEVEVLATKFFAGDWDRANSTLVTMKTDEGHILKTFSSGEFGREVEKGQRVTITGTVKAHSEYNGAPETTLIRVKRA